MRQSGRDYRWTAVRGLLTGAFIIEAVFAWHGIGELAVQAFAKGDFPMIQGIALVVATTLLVNLVVDIIYAASIPDHLFVSSSTLTAPLPSRSGCVRFGPLEFLRRLFRTTQAQLGCHRSVAAVHGNVCPVRPPICPYELRVGSAKDPPSQEYPLWH